MKILAFGHRQNTGKSTLTRFLVSELRIMGKNVKQAGFADMVKCVAHQLFAWGGLMPAHYYDDNYDKKNIVLDKIGKSPRDLWIGVGNGIRQATGYDGVWSQYLFNTVKADVLIISDLRFPGEAEAIRAAGGFNYRIDRDCAVKVTDGADDPLEDYTGWEGIIDNNSDLPSLFIQAKLLIERHFNDTGRTASGV